MATIGDLRAARTEILKALDEQIQQAASLRTLESHAIDEMLNLFVARLTDLHRSVLLQDVSTAIDSATLAEALAVLRAATKEMNDVAASMVSARAFIESFSRFESAANRAQLALAASSLPGDGVTEPPERPE